MKKIIILFLPLIFGCSKTIYLNNEGKIEYIGENYVTIFFDCENSKRADCFGYADFSKKSFPFAYIGEKVIITKQINYEKDCITRAGH